MRRFSLRSSLAALALILFSAAWLLPAGAAYGQVAPLSERVDEIRKRIAESPLGEPIDVDSHEADGTVHGEIHALVDHGLPKVAEAFQSAGNWCEIMFLHLNIKACVDREHDDGSQFLLTYIGRKHFQPPRNATPAELEFRVVANADDRVEIELTGERGPHGTGAFRMELEAIPGGPEQTLMRFRYSLQIGAVTRGAMAAYLMTAGRHRVGFSRVGETGDRVRGMRGMIERNVMRFYLGLQAYLDTLHVSEDERLTARLENWFDLTERYPDQLRELDRETYLSQKRREWAHQGRL